MTRNEHLSQAVYTGHEFAPALIGRLSSLVASKLLSHIVARRTSEVAGGLPLAPRLSTAAASILSGLPRNAAQSADLDDFPTDQIALLSERYKQQSQAVHCFLKRWADARGGNITGAAKELCSLVEVVDDHLSRIFTAERTDDEAYEKMTKLLDKRLYVILSDASDEEDEEKREKALAEVMKALE